MKVWKLVGYTIGIIFVITLPFFLSGSNYDIPSSLSYGFGVAIILGLIASGLIWVVVDIYGVEGYFWYKILVVLCTGIILYFVIGEIKQLYIKKGWKFLD